MSMHPAPPRAFKQVDVFSQTPCLGNPLAVVLDGTGLDDATMQRFARWTHLSETTFLLPPTQAEADYRVRIFTPGGELPFAGHPTLGSCHAWLEAGNRPRAGQWVVQQCEAGLVRVRRHESGLAFAAPPMRRSAPSPSTLSRVAGALGLKAHHVLAAQLLDNGPVWLGLLLDQVDRVLALRPDHGLLAELGLKVGVAAMPASDGDLPLIARGNREARAFAASAAPSSLEVRAFAAAIGIEEDPVTGSLQASLAQWLIDDGHLPPSYLATQGQCLGRAGRVQITRDEQGTVWVGGACVTCIDGTLHLPRST